MSIVATEPRVVEETAKSGKQKNAVMELIEPATKPGKEGTFRCKVCGRVHKRKLHGDGNYAGGPKTWRCVNGCKLPITETQKKNRLEEKTETLEKKDEVDVETTATGTVAERASDNSNNDGTVSGTATEEQPCEYFGNYLGNPCCAVCNHETECWEASRIVRNEPANQPESEDTGQVSIEPDRPETASVEASEPVMSDTAPVAPSILGSAYLPCSELKEHYLNAKIYGDSYDNELLKSIGQKGILVPLLITRDNTIISGHRRFRAAQALSITEVPVTTFASDDTLDIEEAVLDSNKQRVKTNSQVVNTYRHYKKIEEERAKRRLATSTGGKEPQPVENCPQAEKGKSRDKAGDKVGKSGKTMERAVKVQDAIDTLKKEGKTEAAQKIEKIFNEKGGYGSISGALKEVEKHGSSNGNGASQGKEPKKAPKQQAKKVGKKEGEVKGSFEVVHLDSDTGTYVQVYKNLTKEGKKKITIFSNVPLDVEIFDGSSKADSKKEAA